MARLPVELIYEIIEDSLEDGLSQTATLARVSHEFYQLVRPILCKTLMYYDDEPEKHWPVPVEDLSRWLEINGHYVRNMIWGIDVQPLPDLFDRCPHLINLAVWVNVCMHPLPPILPSVSRLHITHLSIDLEELFSCSKFLAGQAQHEALSSITHLDLFHSFSTWQSVEGLAYLPCLTHLCLPENVFNRGLRDVVDSALCHCKLLKVLVLIVGLSSSESEDEFKWVRIVELHGSGFDRFETLDDPRVVAVERGYVNDWECGALRGRDMWTLAEETVERRLAGVKER